MSNTSQGPGWWLASDGKWYPPELWTGPPTAAPAAAQAAQPTGPAQLTRPAQPTVPAYPAQGSAYGAGGSHANYGYGQSAPQTQGASHGQAVQRKTNGLAIASLVCSCAGLIFITAILGVIFGFIARAQIKGAHGTQKGDGLAIAGIVVGFGWIALTVLVFALGAGHKDNNGAIVIPIILTGHLGLGGPFT